MPEVSEVSEVSPAPVSCVRIHVHAPAHMGRDCNQTYETYETSEGPPAEVFNTSGLTTPVPDPLDALRGPRRTAWNTLVWSDPGAPPIQLFGPP